jgi:hypothetical protein
MASPNIKARLEKLERKNPPLDRLALLSDEELEALVSAANVIIEGNISGKLADWPAVADAMALHNVAFSRPQFEALCYDLSTNIAGATA